MAAGDYETMGVGDQRVITGTCAGCLGDVSGGDAYVIRYSLKGERGGIFHRACAPKGAQWYALDAVTEQRET